VSATLQRFGKTFAYGNEMGGIKPNVYRKNGSKGAQATGALVLEGVPAFRSGTFRDSMGYQNTWEGMHLRQMLMNWDHLTSTGIFKDVPVRDGHPGWVVMGLPGNGKVVGYHSNVRVETLTAPHDGKDYDYWLVDYEILDEEAAKAIESGLWRNRSAEIGTYKTNDETEFWPVYMGVAYVDIPAVEGLQFSKDSGVKLLDMIDHSKETGVGDVNPTNSTPPAQGEGAGFFNRDAVKPFTFSIAGQSTTDPVAVQQHIQVLEKFQSDLAETARVDFVNGLAKENKIAATQLDGALKFAKGLSADQFEDYKAMWADAPASSLLSNHGQTVTNADNSTNGGGATAVDSLDIARQTVASFKQAGLSRAHIEQTPSFKALVAAGEKP
jgi:hypothetical protein